MSISSSFVSQSRSLEGKKGYVKPAQLVEFARPEDSPIHSMFEWDNERAADAHRLQQARTIINRVQVEMVGDDKSDAYYSARVHIQDVPVRGYFPAKKVLSDDELYASVIKDAIREIRYWQRKFKGLKEMREIINEERIDALERQIEGR